MEASFQRDKKSVLVRKGREGGRREEERREGREGVADLVIVCYWSQNLQNVYI